MGLAEPRVLATGVIGNLSGGTWDTQRRHDCFWRPAEARYSSFSLHAAESKPRKGNMQSAPCGTGGAPE